MAADHPPAPGPRSALDARLRDRGPRLLAAAGLGARRRDPGQRFLAVAAGVGAVLALVLVPGDGRDPGPEAAEQASQAGAPGAGRASEAGSAEAGRVGEPRSFTLVAGGDVLLHEPLWAQAEADAAAAGTGGLDFRPLLAGVAPVVQGADVAICHLETPLAPPGGPYRGYPAFSGPPEIAPALADTGFDACSTASNHTFDQGAAGIDRTLATLDAAGVRHAGSARTPAEAEAITLIPTPVADVALLSYTFGFNGIPAPGGEDWRGARIDEGRILSDAARARTAGAEVVVVALHWGEEYRTEPTATQRDLGPRLVASPDVDLVLGHHAHVVQPVEAVGDEWLVYGMGNFVADHETVLPANEEGLLVRFVFTEGPAGWRATAAEYFALLVRTPGPPIRLVDAGMARSDPGLAPADRARAQEAWDRTTAAVGALGDVAAGMVPVCSVSCAP
jgi:poly-gamma-glutamate capsule biosynthesis protein CapA/YwtB (metallophosphatase superfamily)